MPDIAMCQEKNCPLSQQCYRFMAIPSEGWQSYFKPDPEICTNYLPIDGRRTVKREIEDDR